MPTIAARYIHKPIEVLAVEVTEDNLEGVADWCNGNVFGSIDHDNSHFWHIASKEGDGSLVAFIGDFIVLEDEVFYSIPKEEFFERYDNINAAHSGGIWLTNPFSG